MPSTVLLDSAYPFTGITEQLADRQNLLLPYRTSGVVRGVANEFLVQQAATGPNMSVDVATGRAIIQAIQGNSGSVKNLTIAASDPTNPRIDLVTLRFDSSTASGAIPLSLVVTTGTPGPVPVAPTPKRSGGIYEISIATVLVGAGGVSIPTANITDARAWSTTPGFTVTPSVASAAALTLPVGYIPNDPMNLIIPVGGTATITSIVLPGGFAMPAGSVVVLEFLSSASVTAGVTLLMPSNFTANGNPSTAALTLQADGSGNWKEISRTGEATVSRAANTFLSGPTTGADAAPGYRAIVEADIPNATLTSGSKFASQSANRVLASPDNAAGTPGFRALVHRDIGTIWTTWTPVCTQSGVVALTVGDASYCVVGKLVTIYLQATISGTGTTNNDVIISGWPSGINPAAFGNTFAVGAFAYLDSGSAFYAGAAFLDSQTTLKFVTNSAANPLGRIPNIAIANPDTIAFTASWKTN